MARLIGPDESSREVKAIVNGVFVAKRGRPVQLWADAAATVPADVLTLDGAPVPDSTVTVDSSSMLPLVQYPDGVDVVYGTCDGGPAWPVYARTDDRLDALGVRVGEVEEVAAGLGEPALLYVRSSGNDNNDGRTPRTAKATIGAALTALAAGSDVGVIDLGTNQTHTLTAGITLDATRHELRGGPRCVIDCSGMTSGTAITVTGNPPAVGTRSARAVLTDIEMVGPGKDSSVDAVLFGDSTAGHGVYHLGPTRVHASHFRRAFSYGDNTWAVTLWNCTAHTNGAAIYFPTNTSAAGERVTYVSCTFHDNDLVAHGGHGGGAFFFADCSMTYCTKFITLTGGHKAFLTDCHLETSDSGTATLFDVGHSAGYLRVNGGIFMTEGSTPLESRLRPSYVTVDDGNVVFSDVFMQGIGLASGTFATGDGVCEIRNTKTSVTEANPAKLIVPQPTRSLLADGGMEQATVWDKWAIVNDTAAITNRLTGTNISLTTSTDIARAGARSLKAAVTALAATTRFGLLVSVREGRPMTWQLYLAIPGAQTGNVVFQGTWVTEYAMASHGVPLFNNVASDGSLTVTKSTAAALSWTVWDSGNRLRYPPPSATHLLLRVDVSAMGAGPIYLDDASVYYW